VLLSLRRERIPVLFRNLSNRGGIAADATIDAAVSGRSGAAARCARVAFLAVLPCTTSAWQPLVTPLTDSKPSSRATPPVPFVLPVRFDFLGVVWLGWAILTRRDSDISHPGGSVVRQWTCSAASVATA